MEKIFVYLGAHKGATLIRLCKKFTKCYVFEPNPELFKGLEHRFKNFKNIVLINAAIGKEDGENDFNIYDFPGAESLGKISEGLEHPSGLNFKLIKTIKVKVLNLYNFLQKEGIEVIDYYLSDIQGMDFTVLQTLKPLLEKRSINKITCEVEKDEKPVLYSDMKNKFSDFQDLLEDNYRLVSNETEPSWITSDVTWVSKNLKTKWLLSFCSFYIAYFLKRIKKRFYHVIQSD